MSLYNALFGVNDQTPALLRLLDLTMNDVPRFRDAYIAERSDKRLIAVYTRMGGGNRGCWEMDRSHNAVPAHGGAGKCGAECLCECYGCMAVKVLKGHALSAANGMMKPYISRRRLEAFLYGLVWPVIDEMVEEGISA